MESKNCSDMTNAEIKQHMLVLENEFEAKKTKLKEIIEELKEIETEYTKAATEINLRKTIF